MPARATASRIAAAPRPTAEQDRSAEPYLPTGVLTADVMTVRLMAGEGPQPECKVARGAPTVTRRRARMDTELLVIGAGPYALSTAALARDCDVHTVIVGRPMAFWRENMPSGMFLR